MQPAQPASCERRGELAFQRATTLSSEIQPHSTKEWYPTMISWPVSKISHVHSMRDPNPAHLEPDLRAWRLTALALKHPGR